MLERRLGAHGPMVSALALGGHEYLPDGKSRGFNEDMKLAVSPGYIGSGYGGPKRKELLGCAYELGINLFDVTIDSEKEALGRNFREMPPPYEVFVQTRPEGMCYSYDQGNRKMLDGSLLRAEVQRGLQLLGRESLDFLNIGLLSWSIDGDADYLPKLAENISALKREGLIRWVVADSFSGERLYLAMIESGAFDVVNIDLNLGDALGLRKVLPVAREARMGIIAREAFFKGELFRIGGSIGIDDRALLARVAMKWLATQRPDTLIVGVDDAAQLIANAKALQTPAFDAEEQATFDLLRRAPKFMHYESAKRREFLELAS
jgi:aryl-alcohol dehydrogenase-like predicted oxidoreductase